MGGCIRHYVTNGKLNPISGSTAGQILLSDGSKLQAGGAGTLSSLALGGATIGTNALAVTGNTAVSGALTITGSPPTINLVGTQAIVQISGSTAIDYNISRGSCWSFANSLQVGGGFYAGAVVLTSGSAFLQFLDTNLQRDAVNTLAQVSGTSPQILRIYGTSSSSNANYERVSLTANYTDWLGNPGFGLQTEYGGTGLARNLSLYSAGNGQVYVRGAGIFMPDGGSFGSNLYYNSGWKNHADHTPGWLFQTNYSSNLITFRAAALQATADATVSLLYPWSIDAGSSYFGVWSTAPSYPLDVTGDVNTSTKYRIGGNVVLAGQSTGYGTPTNGAKQASFDATSITLVNLAKCVAQLIVDLKAGNMPAA
jgi:hypothetical protein